ncbi:MAG TPA: peptidylprolyl isomerase [Candidatus Methylomirabilis sp.]
MKRWAGVGVGVLGGILWALSAGAAAPEGQGDAKRVVATVNMAELTYDDFKQRIKMLELERGPVTPDRFAEVLRAMVREEILYQAAVGQQLDTKEEVKKRLEISRRQVLIEELLRQKVTPASQVTEEEVKKAYEDNKIQLTTEAVKVSHIMVKTETEAETIQTELKAGKSFEELAKAKSQDAGSAEKGGDLGMLSRGQTEPEFETAAFALKDGEVSGVVKTQYGYHIIKVLSHETTLQPYDEVKDRLREMLGKQKQRDVLMKTMAEYEQGAKTEVYEDRLR